MIIKKGCSTERVRKFRQRQREASRKLVRFYLDAETGARIDQLASGKSYAEFAAALLTAAISQAWSANQALQKEGTRITRGGRLQASCEPTNAGAARLAQFPGRRRGLDA